MSEQSKRILYCINARGDCWTALLKSFDKEKNRSIIELLGGLRDGEILKDVPYDALGSKHSWRYPK